MYGVQLVPKFCFLPRSKFSRPFLANNLICLALTFITVEFTVYQSQNLTLILRLDLLYIYIYIYLIKKTFMTLINFFTFETTHFYRMITQLLQTFISVSLNIHHIQSRYNSRRIKCYGLHLSIQASAHRISRGVQFREKQQSFVRL